MVHAGIVMLFAAFAGLAFKADHDISLRSGEVFETRDPYGHQWRFTSQGVSTSKLRDRETMGVTLDAWRDGKRAGFITAEKRTYVNARGEPLFDPATEVGIMTTLKQDTYVVLVGVRDADMAEIAIHFNPLVMWVWIGGFVMMIGGLIVMWPQAERRSRQGGYAAVMPPEHATATVTASV